MTSKGAGMAKGAMVKVEGLRKNYGTVEAVRGVSLEVQRGEVVVIIGPSGCGKSTFLRCINLLEEPSAGSLQVLDRRIEFGPKNSIPRGRDLARFRAGIGMVFQQFDLFPHKTVLDNVMAGPVIVKKMAKTEAEPIARVEAPQQCPRHDDQARAKTRPDSNALPIRAEAERDRRAETDDPIAEAGDHQQVVVRSLEELLHQRPALQGGLAHLAVFFPKSLMPISFWRSSTATDWPPLNARPRRRRQRSDRRTGGRAADDPAGGVDGRGRCARACQSCARRRQA